MMVRTWGLRSRVFWFLYLLSCPCICCNLSLLLNVRYTGTSHDLEALDNHEAQPSLDTYILREYKCKLMYKLDPHRY